MTWFGQLLRRLFGWFGSLGRPGHSPVAQQSLAPTPVGPPVVIPSIPSESSGGVAGAAASLSLASPVVQAADVGPAAAPSVVVKAAVAKPATQPVRPSLDPGIGQVKVRQYFARMVAATPAGLTIDFDDWRSASVERFFLAMTSPGLTRRREPPTSGVEQLSVTNAFQGFEWD